MAKLQRDPEMTTAIAAGLQAVASQAVPALSTNSRLFLLTLFMKTATADCGKHMTHKYRIIRNDCRSFNNLSYTIHLREEYMYFFI